MTGGGGFVTAAPGSIVCVIHDGTVPGQRKFCTIAWIFSQFSLSAENGGRKPRARIGFLGMGSEPLPTS